MDFVPQVSVIVPVFNSATTIQACVESLRTLDYPKENLELIVIDNGSTDRTADVLNQYHDQLRILGENKRGAAAARNRGLRDARGEIIALTDADCVVDKDWLKHIISPLQDEQIGIVGGRIQAHCPCNSIELFGEMIHDHRQAIEVFKPGYVITMNWSSRRSVIEAAGWFDEELLRDQDVDLSWRVLQKGYRLAYEPAAIVYHWNEKTLRGLFHEGYTHGYYGVRVCKKHAGFLRDWGYSRWQWRSYGALLAIFFRYAQGKGTLDSLYAGTFSAGKHLGRLLGAARWLYPGL
jgi:O-antigen biosynthesis protein